MRKFFIPLFLLVAQALSAAPVKEEIVVDGLNREFYVYTPAGIDNSKGHPVLVVLHGLGGSALGFTEKFDAQSVCDEFGAVLVFPQALPEQDPKITSSVSILKETGSLPETVEFKNSWGAGARITVESISQLVGSAAVMLPILIPDIVERGYGELNEGVDDVNFINSLIDQVDKEYNINDSIFVCGGSMGGAMTFKYAYSDKCRAMKVCSINGFVGGGVDTVGKALKVPALIFNSKGDAVVQYEGGLFNGSISEMIKTMGRQNGCTVQLIADRVDLKDDGNEIFEFGYRCEGSPEMKCFISSNASHDQFLNGKENDIDFLNEMEKFFFGRASAGCGNVFAKELCFYPNPVENVLYCDYSGTCEVLDLTGRVVLSAEVENGAVDLSALSAGNYIFSLKTSDEVLRARIVKK